MNKAIEKLKYDIGYHNREYGLSYVRLMAVDKMLESAIESGCCEPEWVEDMAKKKARCEKSMDYHAQEKSIAEMALVMLKAKGADETEWPHVVADDEEN